MITKQIEESEALSSIERYNDALREQDLDAQVDFFSASRRREMGITEAEDRSRLQNDMLKGVSDRKRFDLSNAVVEVDGNSATVDQVPLRSPTGNGTFTFQMTKEGDGIWRCTSLFLSKLPDTLAENARTTRERVLADPERPGYHFVIPEGVAMPFDPNGAIFWQGRYHLFYIFQDSRSGGRADHWGHMSSKDLFHWQHHPTKLLDGMYSGNCYLNREGIPTMCYHQKGIGNAMAVALDDDLNDWKKLESNPITPETHEGDKYHDRYRSWDPFGWLEDDTYYAIFGGSRPAIAKSLDLDSEWEYVGDLFAHGVDSVSLDEDVSCPDLFRLGDRHVLLCISHRMGCRYYIGDWRDEQFHPESHGQMSWVDNTFFAPESLVDNKGRRIMWAWLMDEPEFGVRSAAGWSGTLSLPRVLSLDSNGTLLIDVPAEIKSLRHDEVSKRDFVIHSGEPIDIVEARGSSLELNVEFECREASACGVNVCVSSDGKEATSIYYDAKEKRLKVDTRLSGPDDTPKVIESAPFELADDEKLKLRVFVDKSVVEVFANRRQAIARRIYPSRRDSIRTILFSQGGDSLVSSFIAWKLASSNPF